MSTKADHLELVSMVRRALAPVVDDHLDPSTAQIRELAGGSSNQTLRVAWPATDVVLRMPPVGTKLDRAHDLHREYLVLRAIADRGVPVPAVHAWIPAAEVAPEGGYVMSYIEGSTATDLDERLDRHAFDALCTRSLEVLAAIHAISPRDAGLDARPAPYVERQLRRWARNLASLEHRGRLDGLDRVHGWLDATRPSAPDTALIHGDYGLHNMVLRTDGDVDIAAVIDWELAAPGDPVADLVWFLKYWPGVPLSGLQNPAHDVVWRLEGPSMQEMLARYERISGRDVSAWAWHLVLAVFKETLMAEALYHRYLRGQAPSDAVRRFEHEVPGQVAALVDFIDQGVAGVS